MILSKKDVDKAIIFILFIIVIVPPLFVEKYALDFLIYILSYLALVGAWNIFSASTGYLFLGTSAFFGIGGYFYSIIQYLLPYGLSNFTSGIFCFFLALSIGLPLLRIRGPYFVIASYALSLLFSNIILYYEQVFRGTTGRWLYIPDVYLLYSIMAALTISSWVALYLLRKSRFGYALFSIRGDEEAAEAIGINTTLYKCLAFGIAAFFMGCVGSTLSSLGGYIDTSTAFSPTISFNTLVMGVLGGLSLKGTFISAIILSIVYELFGATGYPYPFFVLMGVCLFIYLLYKGSVEELIKGRAP